MAFSRILERKIEHKAAKLQKNILEFKNLPPFSFGRLKNMAVSVADLIAKREEITAKKKNLFALETSIGDIIIKIPSVQVIADAWDMRNNVEGNQLLILECVIQPNLKDRELQNAFGCAEPIEIVPALFNSGEINRIAAVILDKAGFNENIKAKLYKEVKNS